MPQDAHVDADRRDRRLDAVLVGDGPERARDCCRRVSQRRPLRRRRFRSRTIREIGVGYATVLASRRTYVGELGWELYVPAEFAARVYDDAAWQPAPSVGLRDAGYYAIEALRSRRATAPGAAS